MLAYYVQHLNPFIFHLTDTLGPRWYGLAYLLGFLSAYFLALRLAREGFFHMPPARVPDFVLAACIFGILVGGRLGFVFFYEPSLLWSFSSSFPFWGVLEIWNGGMAAHGGVIATTLVLLYWSRRHHFRFVHLADVSCMLIPIGLFFGRCANFINGELYGHPSRVPWAVQFPSELLVPTNGHFTVPEATRYGLIDHVARQSPTFADYLQTIRDQPHPYDLAMAKLISMAQHGNQFVLNQFASVLPPRHPSQLYEALLEGALLFVICWTIGRRWRKDGMASGAFLTLYPVMRTIGEQFRVGDAPPPWLAWTHLNLGVIYSIPMFFAGLTYWLYFITRPASPAAANAKAAPPPDPSP